MRVGHLLSRRLSWGREISLFGQTAGMFLVGVEAGEWVVGLSLGVLPPSEQMGLEFLGGGGMAPAGEVQRAVFLSKWPTHKMPPLPSPDGTGHCPAFLHLRGSLLSKRGGGVLSAKRGVGASIPFTTCGA